MMRMRSIRYADTFIEGVAGIYSDAVLAALDKRLEAIESFPELGSPDVRPSLIERYGAGIRKLPVPPFVIMYRYDKQSDTLDFLALPYEKTIE